MGLFNGWSDRKRVKEAAKQMWSYVRRGYNFEVPLIFDKNDLTVQAIAEMQKQHPEVELRMYQSRGLVVGLFRTPNGMKGSHGISDQAMDLFTKTGHIENGFMPMTAEDLLGRHEAFLLKQGLDPKQQEKEAQEARIKREAIEVVATPGKLETQEVAADGAGKLE